MMSYYQALAIYIADMRPLSTTPAPSGVVSGLFRREGSVPQ
jgi:hypothetical protein